MFGYLLKPCIEIWNFFLNFGQVMAIEKPQKNMLLALFIYIHLYIILYSQKKRVHWDEWLHVTTGVGPVHPCRGGFPCTGWQVGMQELLGFVWASSLVSAPTTHYDCCDETAVLQFSLRSFLWWFVVFESLWHCRLGLTKKDSAEVFFYFCQCGGFASNRGAMSIEFIFFSPSSRSTISSSGLARP